MRNCCAGIQSFDTHSGAHRMANSLGWLHLSDLHFLSATDWRDSVVLRDLQSDISGRKQEGLAIDLVFCTGDIGFGETSKEPLKSQYTVAKAFFDRVLEICELPPDRLFLVPGNHDIDRSKVLASTTEYFRSPKRECALMNQMLSDGHSEVLSAMQRLQQYREFVELNYQHIALDRNATFSEVLKINGLTVSICGLNSAWTCVDDEDKGQLWLAGHAQLHATADKCGGSLRGVANGDIRIGLIHHPIDWLQPQEASELRASLENEFDFFLHGHEHDSWVRETTTPPHAVIAAGASTANAMQELGYNIVQLRPADSGIFLRSYNKGKGWGKQIVAGRASDGFWSLVSPSFLTRPSEPATTSDVTIAPPNTEGPTFRGHFGLDDMLSRCSTRLRANPALAIYGLAGVGKTVLVEELRLRPEWKDLKSISLVASDSSGARDFFSQLANYLGIRDERPSPPAGRNVAEIVDNLKQIVKDVPPFFLHIARAHHWFSRGQWRQPEVALLINGLVRAIPGSVIVLETREAPADSVLAAVEARGLPSDALKEYLASPPGIKSGGWILNRDQRKYVYQRLGGGHGRGAHAYGLFLLVRLAEAKEVSPYEILKQFPSEYSEELYEKLFREFYNSVLNPEERSLLFACSLYRNGLHYSHLSRLETALPAVDAGQSLIRRRLLSEDAEWLYLHDLASDQAEKLVQNAEIQQRLHGLIAGLWLADLNGQKYLIEANIRRALEAFYHLEMAGQGERVFKIAPELFGRRADETVSALWRLEEKFNKNGQQELVCETLEYLLRVDPDDHKALRFLGELLVKRDGPDSPTAFDCFSRACDLRPDFPNYWANLGNISARRGGDYAKTFLDRLNAAVRTHPSAENHVVVHNRSRCLDALGEQAAASEVRMNEIRGGSRHPQLYISEIGLRRRLQEWTAAIDLIQISQTRGIYNLRLQELHADVVREIGDDHTASAIRRACIAMETSDSHAYVNEATYLLEDGQCAEAIKVLELARSRGLHDDYIVSVLAKAYDKVGGDAGHGSELRMKEINSGSCNAVFFADEIKWLRDNKRTCEAFALYVIAEERNAVSDYVVANYTKALQIAGRGEEASRIRIAQIQNGSCVAALFNDEAFWQIELKQSSVARDLMELAEERGAIDEYSESVRKALGLRELGASQLKPKNRDGGS